MEPKKLVKYDPTRHRKNASGRWTDKVSKRLVSIDPATVPQEAAHAEVAAPLQGVELPPAQTPQAQPAQQPAQTPQEPAQPTQAQPAQPPQAQPAQPPVLDFGEDGEGAGEEGEEHRHHHIGGCWRGAVEGVLCSCGVRVFPELPDAEAAQTAALAISVFNRVTPYPRPPSEVEIEVWKAALKSSARRFGNPLARYEPFILLAVALGGTVAIRRSPEEEPGTGGAGGV